MPNVFSVTMILQIVLKVVRNTPSMDKPAQNISPLLLFIPPSTPPTF